MKLIIAFLFLVFSVSCRTNEKSDDERVVWRNGYYLDIDGEDYSYFVWDDENEYDRFLCIQSSTEPTNILLQTIKENNKCRVLSWRLILPCKILLDPDEAFNSDRRRSVIQKLERTHFPTSMYADLGLDQMSDSEIAAYGISRSEADKLLARSGQK